MWGGYGNFFKAIVLKDNLAFLAYFTDAENSYSLKIKLIDINTNDYSFSTKIEKTLNEFSFSTDILYNDLIKISDKRLIYTTTNQRTYTNLYIVMFDFYNSYSNVLIREYEYSMSGYTIQKELSIFSYNNFFGFTSCVDYPSEQRHSILLIFGYANATDTITDISPYFDDIDNYVINNKIFNKLKENIKIENNIFGYEIINEIKLITIPEQILIYNDENILLQKW